MRFGPLMDQHRMTLSCATGGGGGGREKEREREREREKFVCRNALGTVNEVGSEYGPLSTVLGDFLV